MSSAHPRGAAAQSARRRRRLQARRLLSLEALETRRVFAPVVTSLAATSINEGGTSVLTVDFTDPQLLNNTYRLQVDWGDGAGLATIPVPAANITVLNAATGEMRTTVSKAFADDAPTGTPVDTYNIRAAMLDQSVVSHWRFDEPSGNIAIDSVGVNTGTLLGTPLPTRVPGLVGLGALSFPGIGGVSVNVGNDASLADADGFAIEALIRPTWNGAGNALIYRKEDGDNRILFGFQSDGGAPVLAIGIDVNGYTETELPLNVNLAAHPNGLPNAGTVYLNSPGFPVGANDVVLQDGNTHHVVASYDSATGETALWVDGIKRFHIFDAAGSPMNSGGAAQAHIGSDSGTGEPFQGIIDEVAFYNRSVSPQLVAAHAARGIAGQDYFFQTTSFTISNVPPVVDAGVAATVFEGQFTRNGSFTGNASDTYTATVDYGDGTGVQPLVLTGNTFQLSHAYADNGSYTVTVNVIDDDTGVGSSSFVLTVLNDLPVVSAPAAGQSTTEGSLYTFSLNFVDFGTLDTHTVLINWGDGTTSAGTVSETPFGPPGSSTGLVGSVTASHVYADNGPSPSNNYLVTVTVTDDDGGAGSTQFLVNVVNALPVIPALPLQNGEEGQAFTLVAPFTDPGSADTHTATIAWGDGTTTSATVNQVADTLTGTHIYANDGIYTATITLTDDDGGVATSAVVITVADLIPTVEIVGPPDDTTVRGLPTSFTFTAFDVPADMLGGYTFVIDWGDGSDPEEVFTDGDSIVVSHVFQVEGDYEVIAYAYGADGVNSDGVALPITVTPVGSYIDDEGVTHAVVGGSIFADRIVISLMFSGAIQARIGAKSYILPDADGKIIIYGQDGSDTITVANNVPYDVDMYGQGGNDYLAGGIYNDVLDGGAGNDRLIGGRGENIYYGGDGNDAIAGGSGNEYMYGGAGIDNINGGGGIDIIDGGDGSDRISGGDGNDIIRGGAGNDVIRGDRGHDILIGGDSNDMIYGSVGRDILVGGRGADQMYGGNDDDLMIHASTVWEEAEDEFRDEIWLSILEIWLQPGTVQDRADEINTSALQGLDESTIEDDNARDSLYGERDFEWYLVTAIDKTSAVSPDELKTVLEN